ncbi:MAG: hypothetical protein ACKO1U_00185, partial [Bacteroidota bacterium]
SLPDFSSLQELIMRNNHLRIVVARVREEIEKLKSDFPYTVKDQIDDEDWVLSQRAAITQLIDAVLQETDYYNQQIEVLMKEEGA